MKNAKTYVIAIMFSILLVLPTMAQNPFLKPNNTWISISGTVDNVTTPDTFTLDYGKGKITIEMDDWDTTADAYKLVSGDKVTVFGWIDDGMFEKRTIEASSVYVQNLNTYFYASGVDEEDTFVTVTTPIVVGTVLLQGTVSNVSGREFTLNTGTRLVTVDTDTLPYNPMDNEGFQKINKGDRVSVTGTMQDDWFESRELKASSIVTLKEGPKKQKQ